mmetsp:Transcript_20718/g.49229  ORF Transcript_20718/g.49229 Transcript_20718/m.49229 type:complete len:87 (+) Transcript_20718:650-910(+)
MLCHMAIGDQVACRRALEMYMDKDINFPDTQECKLLQGCVQAMEDEDVEAYTQAVFDFDQIKKLDKWRTSMLLKTKKKMSAGGGLL